MDLIAVVSSARAREALRQDRAGLLTAIDGALHRGAQELARAERKEAPKAFSNLVNSISARRVGPLHYRVSPGVQHAVFVHEGRRAGPMPGISHGLMEWVRFRTGARDRDLERMTFVIARAIGQRGIRPNPFVDRALTATEPAILAGVAAAVDRVAGAAGRG